MNTNNLYFHIHYCNRRQSPDDRLHPIHLTRTLNHHELILVTGGKASVVMDNKRYQARKGMLFYIWPDVLHTIQADLDDPLYMMSVHFSYARVGFSDNKWDIGSEGEILPLEAMVELGDYYHIEPLFRKMVESWYARLPGYEFITRALFQQVTYEAIKNAKNQHQDYGAALKVEELIRYMRENICGRVTLAELAGRVQLSPTYLSRIFRECTGYGVIMFFNKMKIDKSKELMIEGGKKLKEVAQVLGFSDEFYFSRVFKKIEGINPSEFYSKNVHGF